MQLVVVVLVVMMVVMVFLLGPSFPRSQPGYATDAHAQGTEDLASLHGSFLSSS
jgi:hypothetical protein